MEARISRVTSDIVLSCIFISVEILALFFEISVGQFPCVVAVCARARVYVCVYVEMFLCVCVRVKLILQRTRSRQHWQARGKEARQRWLGSSRMGQGRELQVPCCHGFRPPVCARLVRMPGEAIGLGF